MSVSQTIPISYSAEAKRKALHIGALIMPVGMLVLGKEMILLLLVPVALLALAGDWARVRIPFMHRLVNWIFAPIMRLEEQPPLGGPVVINGATWMFVSSALCAALLPVAVAAPAVAMLMIGDGAAALVGRRFGRTRYPFSNKSLEGSLAFFVVGFLVAVPFVVLAPSGMAVPSIGVLLLGAALAAALEAFNLPVNDNVGVPLGAGALMVVLMQLGL
jgi:dolichol kinase